MNVLQDLYDSEINFQIITCWDAGFEVSLGDSINGFKSEANCDTLEEALEFLRLEAVRHYPDSLFAMRSSHDEATDAS